MSKYVIVGGSATGMGAIEAIREVDSLGRITLISEEVCPYYSRPMISDLVSGKADFNKMKCREDNFWKKKISIVSHGRIWNTECSIDNFS